MNKKSIVWMAFLWLPMWQISAQRLWVETELAADVLNVLELSLSPEIRLDDQMEMKEYFIQPALKYTFNEYLKLGAGLRFGNSIDGDGNHEAFRRYHLDAQTGYQWKGFTPSLRLRFTNADDFGDSNAAVNYLRYRTKLKYKFKDVNLRPYVLYEWYRDTEAQAWTKSRFEGGVMYKISKRNKIGLYYRSNHYLSTQKDTKSIVGISYKFKL